MLSYFVVREKSMEPWVGEGDFVLGDRMSYLFFKPRVGHVVVARHPQKSNMLLLKRIVAAQEGMYWIQGDNGSKSKDSRHFGWVGKEYIVGKAHIVGKPRTRAPHKDKSHAGQAPLGAGLRSPGLA